MALVGKLVEASEVTSADLQPEQLRLFCRAAPFAAATSTAIGALVTVVLSGDWPQGPLLAWFAVLSVLNLGLLVMALGFRRSGNKAGGGWLQGFSTLVLLSGLVWAVPGALLHRLDPDHFAFVALAVAATAAGGLSSYAILRFAALGFLLVVLGGTALGNGILGGNQGLQVAGLAGAYLLLASKLALQSHRAIVDSLRLSMRNAALVDGLKRANQDAEAANQALSAQIKERLETEGELIKSKEDAEQAARAKADFLANMSHEIRTPMNGVVGMTALLLDTDLSTKQRHFASTIQRSADALLSIINDILDFSKIEAGKLQLVNGTFDLRRLIEDSAGLFAEHAHRKRLDFATELAPQAHVAYNGDSGRLRQVLNNLVSNALKFTETGEVIIRVTASEMESGRDLIRFEVRDTGVGIAPESQEKIFDTFSQADGSTTRQHGGTGLGLSICRQLVRLMGGDIGLDSVPGKGSTFWFTCPLQRADAGALPRGVPKADSLKGSRVLIVDDNATNRDILEHQMQVWGAKHYAVASAASALKALRKAESMGKRFDIAIFDKQLPDLDGLELARRVQRDDQISNPQLIMLSSVGNLDETGQWMLAGIAAYLNKPVRQVELYEALAKAMGHSAPAETKSSPATPQPVSSFRAYVLVAEDNPVNQELAVSMLETMGCRTRVVANGREAVEAITESPLDQLQDPYDLVLMDCQMPEMDGYAATGEIRAWEAQRGIERGMPIIALTANALEGDRERCLSAGMSDYLSKPFSRDQLIELFARWLPLSRHASLEPVPAAAASASKAAKAASSLPAVELDQKALQQIRELQRAGKPDVLEKVIGMYLDSATKLLDELRSGVVAGNSEAVRIAAHTLKSSSANVGAVQLADLCRELERLGAAADLWSMADRFAELETEYEGVCDALRRELKQAA